MRRNPDWLAEPAEHLFSHLERGTFKSKAISKESAGLHFDFIVVGSGYGGAVAASRLAKLSPGPEDLFDAAGFDDPRRFSVAVLERGREYVAGTFPSTFAELPPHVRMVVNRAGVNQYADGLFDLRIGGDVWALMGNGLGGGSLINAGVTEQPAPSVLRDESWPLKWREPSAASPSGDEADPDAALPDASVWKNLFERAAGKEGVHAQQWETMPAKTKRVRDFASAANTGWRKVHTTIAPPSTTGTGVKGPGGVTELPCKECGDCFTGCNHQAKRTLSHTYLARARQAGASLYTGVTVRAIERDPGDPAAWLVKCVLTDAKKRPVPAHDEAGMQSTEFALRTRHVILSAGTFGSTEILTRSRQRGLTVSSVLGSRFSANGDMFGATYNAPYMANAAPRESTPPDERKVGPTITAMADARFGPYGQKPFVVEDLAVPGPLRRVYEELLTSLYSMHRWVKFDLRNFSPNDRDPLSVDDAAIDRSMLYAVMGRDSAAGRLEMMPGFADAPSDGGLMVKWPELRRTGPNKLSRGGAFERECAFADADTFLGQAGEHGGTYLSSPLWRPVPSALSELDGVPDPRVFTTHPLGGCPMGKDATEGVVDDLGRVFNASASAEESTHFGLYVLDGSIVPLSLGINPLLTITALAEGIVDEWEKTFGWNGAHEQTIVAPLPPEPRVIRLPQPATPVPTTMQFTERMSGPVAGAKPDKSAKGGEKQNAWRLELTTQFDAVPDLATFLKQPSRSLGQTISLHLLPPAGQANASLSARTKLVEGLRGQVYWLERERSWVWQRMWRALVAFGNNRLHADVAAPRKGTSLHFWSPVLYMLDLLWKAVRASTTVGDARQLRYEFAPLREDVSFPTGVARGLTTLPAGTVLFGAKRLAYETDSNPWRQLSDMTLKARLPGRNGQVVCLADIEFDQLFMLGRYETRLRLTRFADAPSAWLDLASLNAYMLRVITSIHFWSFRGADYPLRRKLERLPKAFLKDGVRDSAYGFETYHFEQPLRYGDDDWRSAARGHLFDPLTLRLSRYWKASHSGADGTAPKSPVILFHGFGSGGVQFTHEAIPVPLARHLADQGFDVWVAELRTSIGLESSHQQWTMDEVALNDVPALVQQVLNKTGCSKVSVVAHCIGSAMFCMAALKGQPCIYLAQQVPPVSLSDVVKQAVLLQVGPFIRLPVDNRVRGYIGRWVQRVMGVGEVSSTADDSAEAMERLAERLIGTFPVPKDERPAYRLTGNLRRNRQLVNAKRSAAVFARLFEMENMPDAVLEAMPDLLGHCNMKTYRQTAHYTFVGKLTDFAGSVDAYASYQNIQDHFGFPVRFIHGEKNVVFAPDTTDTSIKVIKALHGIDDLHDNLVRDRIVIPGFGHLDPLVSDRAEEKVFGHISAFLLAQRGAVDAPQPSERQLYLRFPSVGPWLGGARLIPSTTHPKRKALSLNIALRGYDKRGLPFGVLTVCFYDDVPDLSTVQLCMPIDRPAPGDEELTISYELDYTKAANSPTGVTIWVACAYKLPGQEFPLDPAAAVSELQKERGWMQQFWDDPQLDDRPPSVINLSADWLRRLDASVDAVVPFALASCRQPPLIVDRTASDASMGRLRAFLEDAQHPDDAPQFALLVGDQIYADPSAGQFDPDGVHDKFVESYREAFTAPNQAEVMRRIPCYMMFDDHEFWDNYAPRADYAITETDFHLKDTAYHAERFAMKYQIRPGPGGLKRTPGEYWYELATHGLQFFVCDTRSERCDPVTFNRSTAAIMHARQMQALKHWLAALQNDKYAGPKFVVSPVPVFPRMTGAQAPLETSSDAWERFPNSFNELITFIASANITNVTFLSGDAHCFFDVSASLRNEGQPAIAVRAIVAPGLYAPYPFANAWPDEYLAGEDAQGICVFEDETTHWSYAINAASTHNGWVRLKAAANSPVVACEVC